MIALGKMIKNSSQISMKSGYTSLSLENLLYLIRNTSLFGLVWLSWLFQILAVPGCAAESSLRVALYVDGGTSASEFRKEFRNSDDILWKSIDGEDIRNGVLRNFDALVVPGGRARKEAESMGADSREEVRRFVNEGGIYMGVCAGAYLASQARDTYLGLLPLKTLDQEHWYRVDDMTPLDVDLTPAGMEILGVNHRNIRILYENGPIFAPLNEKSNGSLIPLGFFRSEVVEDGGRPGVMLGAPAMVLSRYGQGMVLAISPHPEETPGLKNSEVHALHWLYDHRNAKTPALAKNSLSSSNSIAMSQPSKPQLIDNKLRHGSAEGQDPSYSFKLNEEAIKLAQSIFDRASVVRYTHRDVAAARQVVM
jgi:putative intracellular protease/amidase